MKSRINSRAVVAGLAVLTAGALVFATRTNSATEQKVSPILALSIYQQAQKTLDIADGGFVSRDVSTQGELKEFNPELQASIKIFKHEMDRKGYNFESYLQVKGDQRYAVVKSRSLRDGTGYRLSVSQTPSGSSVTVKNIFNGTPKNREIKRRQALFSNMNAYLINNIEAPNKYNLSSKYNDRVAVFFAPAGQ